MVGHRALPLVLSQAGFSLGTWKGVRGHTDLTCPDAVRTPLIYVTYLKHFEQNRCLSRFPIEPFDPF